MRYIFLALSRHVLKGDCTMVRRTDSIMVWRHHLLGTCAHDKEIQALRRAITKIEPALYFELGWPYNIAGEDFELNTSERGKVLHLGGIDALPVRGPLIVLKEKALHDAFLEAEQIWSNRGVYRPSPDTSDKMIAVLPSAERKGNFGVGVWAPLGGKILAEVWSVFEIDLESNRVSAYNMCD
jgi:hypothetical protein